MLLQKGQNESCRYVLGSHFTPLNARPTRSVSIYNRFARAFCDGGQLQFVMPARASRTKIETVHVDLALSGVVWDRKRIDNFRFVFFEATYCRFRLAQAF